MNKLLSEGMRKSNEDKYVESEYTMHTNLGVHIGVHIGVYRPYYCLQSGSTQ